MVGHDAPNALGDQYRALVDAITQRSPQDTEMDRRIIGQLVAELSRALRQVRLLQHRLSDLEQQLHELSNLEEQLREPRKA